MRILTNLGGAGLSGSQDLVTNETVSLAPPRNSSVIAWIRIWYSVQGLKSVSQHSKDKKNNLMNGLDDIDYLTNMKDEIINFSKKIPF